MHLYLKSHSNNYLEMNINTDVFNVQNSHTLNLNQRLARKALQYRIILFGLRRSSGAQQNWFQRASTFESIENSQFF